LTLIAVAQKQAPAIEELNKRLEGHKYKIKLVIVDTKQDAENTRQSLLNSNLDFLYIYARNAEKLYQRHFKDGGDEIMKEKLPQINDGHIYNDPIAAFENFVEGLGIKEKKGLFSWFGKRKSESEIIPDISPTKKISEAVVPLEKEILGILSNVYFYKSTIDNEETYYKNKFKSLDSGSCESASAITKYLLEKKGILCEYFVTAPQPPPNFISEYNTFVFDDVNYKEKGFGHILLKCGDVLVDPTFLQLYDQNPEGVPPILVGTKEEIKAFFNIYPLKGKTPKESIFLYLDSLTDANVVDPNYNFLYPDSLHLEQQLKNGEERLTSRGKNTKESIANNPYLRKFKINMLPNYLPVEKRIFLDSWGEKTEK